MTFAGTKKAFLLLFEWKMCIIVYNVYFRQACSLIFMKSLDILKYKPVI